jgi:16S rRNA processing protein RimM
MSNAVPPVVAPADLIELGRVAEAYGVKGWVKIQPYSADADVLLSVASPSSNRASSGKSSSGKSAAAGASVNVPANASVNAAANGSSVGLSADSSADSSAGSSVTSVPTWWLVRPAPPGAVAASAGKSSPARPYAIKAARPHGSHVVAQLEGIDDRDQAEALKGMAVCAPRSAFPAPDEDEYYWIDLIGCTVLGDDNGEPALLGVVGEVVDNGAHAVLKVLRQRQPAQGLDPEPLLDAKGRPIEILVPFVQAHIRAVDLGARRIDSDWPLDF